MKKSILLTFVLAAAFVATFLTGCGSDPAPTCYTVSGRDTGVHVIYLNGVTNAALPQIRDTLDAVVISGDSVVIASKALGQSITGKIDPNDCNKIILDSLILTNTLKFPTTSLPGLDTVRISNVRAGGTGTITAAGATTVINIAKGNTNIIIGPFNLTNLAGLGFSLRGNFLKLP